ncbi:MAG TPA: enoyl-CoA hydratase-related protein [Iamia sp.]
MPVHIDVHADAVRIVTIDRPERRNAIDADHVAALTDAVVGSPEGTRVLVLRGIEGHFCAGADLKGIEGPEFAVLLRGLLHGLRDAPFACIAAVEGAALGAGTQLAVACDLRTTTEDATFGIPAAKLGLMVDLWTVQRLAALAGQGVARSMLLAADTLPGVDAHRLGLAQRLAPPDAAVAWAEEIAAKAPLTIAGHKLMLNALDAELPVDPDVIAAFDRAWASADLVEGKTAFAERRTPVFKGE